MWGLRAQVSRQTSTYTVIDAKGRRRCQEVYDYFTFATCGCSYCFSLMIGHNYIPHYYTGIAHILQARLACNQRAPHQERVEFQDPWDETVSSVHPTRRANVLATIRNVLYKRNNHKQSDSRRGDGTHSTSLANPCGSIPKKTLLGKYPGDYTLLTIRARYRDLNCTRRGPSWPPP